MSERAWCRTVFFVGLLLVAFLGAAQTQELFLVTASELSRLETISQNWEQHRQTQLSQIQRSQTDLRKMQNRLVELTTASESLSMLLDQERRTTSSLRQSFEQSELDHATKAAADETRIKALTAEVASVKIKLETARRRLAILAAILALEILAALAIGALKIAARYGFGIKLPP